MGRRVARPARLAAEKTAGPPASPAAPASRPRRTRGGVPAEQRGLLTRVARAPRPCRSVLASPRDVGCHVTLTGVDSPRGLPAWTSRCIISRRLAADSHHMHPDRTSSSRDTTLLRQSRGAALTWAGRSGLGPRRARVGSQRARQARGRGVVWRGWARRREASGQSGGCSCPWIRAVQAGNAPRGRTARRQPLCEHVEHVGHGTGSPRHCAAAGRRAKLRPRDARRRWRGSDSCRLAEGAAGVRPTTASTAMHDAGQAAAPLVGAACC